MCTNLSYLKNYHVPILCGYLDAYCHVKPCSVCKRGYIKAFPLGFLILEITERNNYGFLYYSPL